MTSDPSVSSSHAVIKKNVDKARIDAHGNATLDNLIAADKELIMSFKAVEMESSSTI